MRIRKRSSVSAAVVALLALLLTASSTLGLSWGSTTRVSGADTANAWGYAMASSASAVFIAYREYDGVDRWIDFRRTTDGGATWSDPVVVSRPGLASFQASLSYAGGVLHLAWTEADEEGVESGWYRRSLDDGVSWTDPVLMTPAGTEIVSSPRVFSTGSTAYYAYTDGTTGAIWLCRSTDAGATFASRSQLGSTSYEGWTGEDYFDGRVSMAFGNGVAYAVYRASTGAIRLRRSTDGGTSWKASVRIGTHANSDPVVAASGKAALVSYSWFRADLQNAYIAVKKSTDKGVTWSSQRQVSSGRDPAFEAWLLRAGGRWRLVYVQCSSSSCGGNVALWFRSSADGAKWTTAQRFSSGRPDALVVGMAYTAADATIWVAWIASDDPDASSLSVYVRGGS